MVDATADPQSWEHAGHAQQKLPQVAAHDISELHKVIESLQEMEAMVAARLHDEELSAVWRLGEARRRLSEERRLMVGRPQLLPRRLLVESPWINFGELGRILFRFYPSGDGSASLDSASVFLWMARPPAMPFNFHLRLGTFSTAPRLWQASAVHYRVDVAWSEVAAALLSLGSEGSLVISVRVLQWHLPSYNTIASSHQQITHTMRGAEATISAAAAAGVGTTESEPPLPVVHGDTPTTLPVGTAVPHDSQRKNSVSEEIERPRFFNRSSSSPPQSQSHQSRRPQPQPGSQPKPWPLRPRPQQRPQSAPPASSSRGVPPASPALNACKSTQNVRAPVVLKPFPPRSCSAWRPGRLAPARKYVQTTQTCAKPMPKRKAAPHGQTPSATVREPPSSGEAPLPGVAPSLAGGTPLPPDGVTGSPSDASNHEGTKSGSANHLSSETFGLSGDAVNPKSDAAQPGCVASPPNTVVPLQNGVISVLASDVPEPSGVAAVSQSGREQVTSPCGKESRDDGSCAPSSEAPQQSRVAEAPLSGESPLGSDAAKPEPVEEARLLPTDERLMSGSASATHSSNKSLRSSGDAVRPEGEATQSGGALLRNGNIGSPSNVKSEQSGSAVSDCCGTASGNDGLALAGLEAIPSSGEDQTSGYGAPEKTMLPQLVESGEPSLANDAANEPLIPPTRAVPPECVTQFSSDTTPPQSDGAVPPDLGIVPGTER